jgi:hypothetical protein
MGYGVYLFFATMLMLASVYSYFFIHETKGLRIDQMDALFGFVKPGTNYARDMGVVSPDFKKESVTTVEVV